MAGRISADVTKGIGSDSIASTTAVSDALDAGRRFSINPDLVKGTRMVGEAPVNQVAELNKRQMDAEMAFMASISRTRDNPGAVIDGLSPQFGNALRLAADRSPAAHLQKQMAAAMEQSMGADVAKSFTQFSPLASGIAPYDLLAPAMLIYPVFSPLRNRIPRVPGQGNLHQGKVITKILGSQPGVLANPSQRMSISEFPGGGSLASWPSQLPGSGSQTAVDVTIPYKFFGLTEAASWLAQFAGQGEDDIAALASLVLLQEFMLGEERSIISATAFNLSAPAAPTLTVRNAGTGETALSNVDNGNVWVRLTAVNYYGETVSSTVAEATGVTSGTSVVDVTAVLPMGALALNIYVGTGSADPGVTGTRLEASAVGGSLFTLQGPLSHSGITPPTVDTGTGSATDYEGIISILSGHAAANSSSGYPADYEAGYYLANAGVHLGIDVLANTLQQLYNGSAKSYFADPAELWCEASDATNLNNDLIQNGANDNYTIFVGQDQVSDAIAGVAVSQFVNPVTRSVIRITVHPYMPQGTAIPISYTLPSGQTNVSNVWENVMVQDYVSINWPVIDVTFRYSLFMFGTLWSPAPQYNGLIQGLQRNDTKPFS